MFTSNSIIVNPICEGPGKVHNHVISNKVTIVLPKDSDDLNVDCEEHKVSYHPEEFYTPFLSALAKVERSICGWFYLLTSTISLLFLGTSTQPKYYEPFVI